MLAVETSGLRRSFGDMHAVAGVDLRIDTGELFGLIGPDGAGKTTLMRLLTGVMSPDSGSVRVFGVDAVARKSDAGMMVGYMPQRFSLYEELTVDENLEFFAKLRSVGREDFTRQRDYLLKFTGLDRFTKRLAGKLSGGMKQKLGLACTLIHQPRLLILDEPTTGVDPVSRREFWQILDSFLHRGMTIFLSTPYMDEADRCTTIALMSDGVLPVVDTPQHIRTLVRGTMLEVVLSDPLRAKQVLARPGPDGTTGAYSRVHILGDRVHIRVDRPDTAYADDVRRILAGSGVPVDRTGFVPATLEDVFVSIIKKEQV